MVQSEAVLLTRAPELRDLTELLQDAGKRPAGTHPVLVHPDPMLSVEETAELEALGVTFMTPTGLWARKLEGVPVGLSLSPGDERQRDAIGLYRHVEDAMRVIARQMLAAGAVLHYGGTWRRGR